jgi:hypothetical protein
MRVEVEEGDGLQRSGRVENYKKKSDKKTKKNKTKKKKNLVFSP